MQPRDAQERPRRARKAPKSVPEPRCIINRAPRTPKSHPRAPQERTNASPKRCDGTPSVASSAFEHNAARAKLWKRFFIVFCVERVPCEVCSDPMKLWFCCIQSMTAVAAALREKTSKIIVLGGQNPPKSNQKCSKIEPRALQDAQKPAKRSNQRSKRRKMRPRSAQDRKIVPTWCFKA